MPRPERARLGRPVAAVARHRAIAGRIAAAIDAGAFPPDLPLPPLRTLQARYGAGYRAVWLAVRLLKQEGRLVSGANRRLAVRAPGPGGTSARAPIVAVIGYDRLHVVMRNSVGRRVIEGFCAGAGLADRPLLLLHGDALNRRLPEGFSSLHASGLLLYGLFQPQMLRAYGRLGMPSVLVDWPNPAWSGSAVYADNAGGVAEAVRRLAEAGHRRIAFVRFVSFRQKNIDLDAAERAAAFLAAMKAHGLRSGPDQIFNALPQSKRSEPGIGRLLRARPRFTAAIASDDIWAQEVIKAALAQGLRVPQDLSIVGFQPLHGPHPSLSGPATDFEELGRMAVQALLASVSGLQRKRAPGLWNPGQTLARRGGLA
ncbi:MAG: substrate-binding domain-containing protein [Planctomycetota bacterium]|nr:substrate-binding domain-containing protein [Planctomycetota bacterium]